jgi:hypothetical protein
MPIAARIGSLAAVAKAADTPENFFYALRDFLDGFYPAPSAEHLRDEPERLAARLNDDSYADAYLAAVAEHLAQAHNLPVPAWANDPTRIVREPRFAFKTPEGRIFLLAESPAAFRARNIFISADALTRV